MFDVFCGLHTTQSPPCPTASPRPTDSTPFFLAALNFTNILAPFQRIYNDLPRKAKLGVVIVLVVDNPVNGIGDEDPPSPGFGAAGEDENDGLGLAEVDEDQGLW